MYWASLLLAAAVPAIARQSEVYSETWYANRPVSSVGISHSTYIAYGFSAVTKTVTTTPHTSTYTYYKHTITGSTRTITNTFTSYVTKAASTVTKAPDAGWIPLTSVSSTSIPSYADKRKRTAVRSSSTASSVASTTTTTAKSASTSVQASYVREIFHSTGYPITETVYPSGATPYAEVTASHATTIHHHTTVVVTATSTITTSIATVFAECLSPENVLNHFDGNPIWAYQEGYYQYEDVFSIPGAEPYINSALQSPFDCCQAAYANGFSGFYYSGQPGPSASCQTPVWSSLSIGPEENGFLFFTNPNTTENDQYVGILGPYTPNTKYAGKCSYDTDYGYCWTFS